MNNTSEPRQWQSKVILYTNREFLICQILLGCSGNVLNLVVLLSRNMRSRTNLIFAVMAFADLFFLLMHIPRFLFFCELLHDNDVYKNSTHLQNGVQNWFSAISIWCMMYATIERVQVFRNPFRTSRRSVSPRFLATIALIVIGALAVTAVHFQSSKASPNQVTRYLLVLHAVSGVFVPLVVLSLLNVLLVLALKKNTMPVHMLKDSQAQQSLLVARNKTERKVTIMVTVIISSFIICNTPGAILYILKKPNTDLTTRMLQSISNSLVITGKVLNFVLFCMSSDHFRALLRMQLVSAFECSSINRRSSCRSATKTFSIPLHDL
ncbi:hypothetical protein Y032_0120g926 [Ancylostoma ceylanicum]|nr:hypothetical protein Y032_0120g926 [Ancylostoma ceylanicum]